MSRLSLITLRLLAAALGIEIALGTFSGKSLLWADPPPGIGPELDGEIGENPGGTSISGSGSSGGTTVSGSVSTGPGGTSASGSVTSEGTSISVGGSSGSDNSPRPLPNELDGEIGPGPSGGSVSGSSSVGGQQVSGNVSVGSNGSVSGSSAGSNTSGGTSLSGGASGGSSGFDIIIRDDASGTIIRFNPPMGDYFDEPAPHGARPNLGFDGGTGEASTVLRKGTALLQGLVRCGVCSRRMRPHYAGPTRSVRYVCDFVSRVQGRAGTCQSMGGLRLQEAVVEAVLEALSPASMPVTLAALERVDEEEDAVLQQLEHRREQARYEADRARRQYDAVEPENRLVARTIGAEWNWHLTELAEMSGRSASVGITSRRP